MEDSGGSFHSWKGPTSALRMLPFGYGLALIAAGIWWIAAGEPFDHATYERIAGAPWSTIGNSFTSMQWLLLKAIIRLTAGNSALLAGSLVASLAWFGYRSRARWVWFTLWLVPLHALIDLALLRVSGGLSGFAALWDVCLAAGIAATLVVSYSQFFALREPSSSFKP